ncbi:MAG: hypothetical protein R3304_12745, partial [Longimicrobiales bacterium]|nr:hypothetical protein [Longimicrobiales bacterium]
ITAWVQSRPTWERSVSSRSAWSLDLPDIVRVLRRRRLPELTWARTMAGGVLAFTVLFGLASVLPAVSRPGFLPGPSVSDVEEAERTAAIFPFRADGAPELVSQGMMDLLGYAAEVVGVRVEHPLVLTRSLDGSNPEDRDAALQAARRLGVRFLATGAVSSPDTSSVAIEASLVDARTGEELRTVSSTGPLRSLPSLVPRLAVDLFAETPLAPSGDLEPTTITDSYDALAAYLEGEASLREGDWPGAVSAFTRARDADPDFALGLARRAVARTLSSGAEPHQRDPDAVRALELRSELPRRQVRKLRGLLLLADGSPEAVEVFDTLTREDPDDPEAWHLLGDAAYHVMGPESPVARDAFERAIELADGYGPSYAHLIAGALARGDTAEAREWWAELGGRQPRSIFLARFGEAVEVVGRGATGSEDAEAGDSIGPRPVPVEASPEPDPLAGARARYGEARTALEDLRSTLPDDRLHAAVAGRVEEVDDLMDQAQAAARDDDYAEAMSLVEDARETLRAVVAAEPVLEDYERLRNDLVEQRSGVGDPSVRSEVDRLERLAQERLAEGRYREAVEALEGAITVLEEAPEAPPSALGDPDEPPPPPPEAIVEDVLEKLAAAMAAEDLDRVRSVWTSISPEAAGGLRDLFDQFRDLSVEYELASLRREGDRIVVQVRTLYHFVAERDGQPFDQEATQVFEIAERNGEWVIVGSRE